MSNIFESGTTFDSISQRVGYLRAKGLKFSPYCLGTDYGELIHSEIFPFIPKKQRKDFLQDQIQVVLGDRLKWIVEWWRANQENFNEKEYADSLATDAKSYKATFVDEENPTLGLFKKTKLEKLFLHLGVSPNLLSPNFESIYGSTPEYTEAFSKAIKGWRLTEGIDGFFHECNDEFELGGLSDFIKEFAHLYRWGDDPVPVENGHDYHYDFDIKLAEELDNFSMKEAIDFISEQYDELEAYEVSSDRCYFSLGTFYFFVVLAGYDKSRDRTEICIFDGWNEW